MKYRLLFLSLLCGCAALKQTSTSAKGHYVIHRSSATDTCSLKPEIHYWDSLKSATHWAAYDSIICDGPDHHQDTLIYTR
jgi:hypothetical protein